MIATVRKGDLYHPTLAGSLPFALASMGTSFVYEYVTIFNGVVPPTGLDAPVWTTPSAPYLLEHAFIILTGACTASVNPGTPTLKMTINGTDLVGGAMTAWGGVNYPIDGANQVMWGLKNGDKINGGLFTNTLPNGGTGDRGAMGGYSTFAALTDGGANGFFNKPVRVHLEHGAGNITMNVPFRVLIIGRLL